MTPHELYEWRKRHGLSQREAAKLLEVGERTFRGYETGERPIRRPFAILVSMYDDFQKRMKRENA